MVQHETMEDMSESNWLSVIFNLKTLAVCIVIAFVFQFSIGRNKRRGRMHNKQQRLFLATDNKIKFHILIPCHIASDRRMRLFFQCLLSVMTQKNYDKEYEVFVGVSGPLEYRKLVIELIQNVEHKNPNITFHISDTKKEQFPQMEHFRHLVKKSANRNSNAYILFLDNDDMFHPLRLAAFEDAYINLGLPSGSPMPLSCKLLLNENVSLEEGKLSNLCKDGDSFYWRNSWNLRRKIQWAPTSKCDDMDATEYMDFMVPTRIMQKFFRVTPVSITSHKFCDLRLLAILERICPIEVIDNPHFPWLLAHYKTSWDTKLENFDTHGSGRTISSNTLEQASVGRFKANKRDIDLSKRFRHLSPGQISIMRGHLESLVIQYIGWNAPALDDVKFSKIMEINRCHGPGIGDSLWRQVESDMRNLFKRDEMRNSRLAWESILNGY